MNYFSKIKAALLGGSTDQVSEGPPSLSPKVEAAKTLNLSAKDIGYARQIKATSVKSFALRALNLTEEEYKWYQDFKEKTTAQKIHTFIPSTESFAQYLSICYAKYIAFKKHDKGRWKYFDHRQHTSAAKVLIEELLYDEDIKPLDYLDKASAATRHLFFAVYTRRFGKKCSKNDRSEN